MAKLDATKERIGHLKLWEGILFAAFLSLVGWVAINAETARVALWWLGLLALAIAGGVIMVFIRRIRRLIDALEGL